MANTIKTKIRLPISKNALEAIKNELRDISVEEDGIYAITRGSALHNLLKSLSKENEEIIAEHSSSVDWYSTIYVERYKDGDSETIDTKTVDIAMHEITDPKENEEILKN